LSVENQITEMVRRLGACPACGAQWAVGEDKDGGILIQGSRPAYAHEMRYDVPGAVRICSQCGNGVDAEGRVIRRRE
jgi:ribosomal protein S27AE